MNALNLTLFNSSIGNSSNNSAIHCSNLLFKYLSLTIFLSLIYVVVIVLGLIGNILIIFIVATKKSVRTSTNIFILNLAVCGIGVVLFFIPRKVSEVFTGQWVWLIPGDAGLALCKIVSFLHGVVTDCSTYSLLLITFDRFCAVVFPHKRSWLSSKIVLALILLAWISSFAINFLFLISAHLHQYNTTLYCFTTWKTRDEYFGYIFTFIVLNIILPIILITFAYTAIFRKLKKQVQVLGDSISDQQRLKESMRQKKIVRMAFVIVCCFAMCWFPFALQVMITNTVYMNKVIPCPFLRFQEVSFYFLVLISVTNPAICFAFGMTFKEELKRILRNIPVRCCRFRSVLEVETNVTDTELNKLR